MSAIPVQPIDPPPAQFYDQNDSDNVCFLCEQPRYSPRYEITHYGFPFRFQACQCGLVKQTPMPNAQFFDWFFNSELFFSAKESRTRHIWGFYDYFKDEAQRLTTSQYRYRKLSKIFEVGRPLEIMKIGPSTGTFLYVANQHQHRAIGCDVSSRFIEYAKDQYQVQIDHGRFEHLDYADGQFDVILLFNVIENIPNQVEFMQAVRKKLKPGGHFILNYVDMKNNLIAKIQQNKYFLYRPPICYIYDRYVLESMLKKFGFLITHSYRDIRYMHMEKIMTLLNWALPLSFLRFLRLHQIPFPVYAYPSRLVIAQRVQ